MSLEENFSDCISHLARSRAGIDFAYTVLLPDRAEVIGCVYFKPTKPPRDGAVDVRSWTTREHRNLDRPVYDAISTWLTQDWPWFDVNYDSR